MVGVLAMLTLQPLAPSYAASSQTSNSIGQNISTGTLKAAAVRLASDIPTGSPLAIRPVGKRAYPFVKNFGTLPLKSFTLTQSVAGTSIYICETSKFVNNSITACESGEVPRLVGSTTTISNFVFRNPLPAGRSYWLAIDAPNNDLTSISISLTGSNYHGAVLNG